MHRRGVVGGMRSMYKTARQLTPFSRTVLSSNQREDPSNPCEIPRAIQLPHDEWRATAPILHSPDGP